jgi:hypothetical protein
VRRTAEFRLSYLTIDGQRYVNLLQLEAGLRDHAESLAALGDQEGAAETLNIVDQLCAAYGKAGGRSQTNP